MAFYACSYYYHHSWCVGWTQPWPALLQSNKSFPLVLEIFPLSCTSSCVTPQKLRLSRGSSFHSKIEFFFCIHTGGTSEGLDGMSVDDECATTVGLPPLPPSNPLPPPKPARREKGPRVMVENDAFSTMYASYSKHFTLYCRGRKSVNQLVPSFVWKNVYADYLMAKPGCTLQEDTLKDRLRDGLKAIKAGTSNEANSDLANLQSDEVFLARLNAVDCYATPNNVLKRRQSLIERCSPTQSPSDTTNVPEPTEGPPPKRTTTPGGASTPTSPTDRPLTKAEMLAKTSKSICALTEHVAANWVGRRELVEAKEFELRSKAGAFKAREESEKEKTLFAHEKTVAQRMRNLEKAKEIGIISDRDFKLRCANLLGL